MSWFTFRFPDFAFSFLSILFEGIPFLLLGSVISGVIDAFLPAEWLTRFLPKRSGIAIVLGALMGAIFPMCECGSVVVIRRFIRKGLPISCAVAYMLGAPIVSPIVALSTFAAFRGQSPLVMTSLRLIFGFCLAVMVGFLVRFIPYEKLLQRGVIESMPDRRRGLRFAAEGGEHEPPMVGERKFTQKCFAVVQAASSDFLDVAFFFVIGAALAATFNTAVNQQVILPLAASPMLSILSMMLLAFVLALCSSTDAFIAASFVAFPFAAKLAFLVFGPLFDVKLFFLYGLIFRRWFVFGLLVGLFVLVALVCDRIAVLGL
ncbi:MAG: uncharacterized protein QOD99_2719 [Chthoniobacter sp.]|jgi:uncharacterized membrane protein YraQ (UPF0718 family)|nr:uncharacterized protein [Chthoniobacter sp.]